MNIKADVDGCPGAGSQNESNWGQNEDFGVKLEDAVQPIQALRLDCNEDDEDDEYDESLLFDDETEIEDIGQAENEEFRFEEEAMVEMVNEKEDEIDEEDSVGENEEDYEESEGRSNAIAIKMPFKEGNFMNAEFDDEDGYTFIKLEGTKDNVQDEENVKGGADDGKRHQGIHYEEDSEEEDDTSDDKDKKTKKKTQRQKDTSADKRHQRVHYEEDSEEEDDTSRDPDYNVEEEEGFNIRRKRVN